MAPQRKIRAVIFDMDGLLLNTEHLYTVAQQQVLEPFGRTFTWDLKAKMMGKKSREAAELLIEELQLQGQLTPEAYLEKRDSILRDLFPTADLLPGVERLLSHLHACGVPIAVATSSTRLHFQLKTSRHSAPFSLFHHIITGDDCIRGKPHPDIFQIAAAGFQDETLSCSDCLVVEDAPSGVEAAKAAGMWALMVPDAKLPKAATALADCVLNSLEEFVPEDWGLPAFGT